MESSSDRPVELALKEKQVSKLERQSSASGEIFVESSLAARHRSRGERCRLSRWPAGHARQAARQSCWCAACKLRLGSQSAPCSPIATLGRAAQGTRSTPTNAKRPSFVLLHRAVLGRVCASLSWLVLALPPSPSRTVSHAARTCERFSACSERPAPSPSSPGPPPLGLLPWTSSPGPPPLDLLPWTSPGLAARALPMGCSGQ
jgi:hypothetical protein